ncbi:hypothetical protein T484DRAFT_3640421 [Baffinella frigidus]|nr:hypothetical protein T484DRAFT_3640421 [Cryptophyta sp. CCMP2293]
MQDPEPGTRRQKHEARCPKSETVFALEPWNPETQEEFKEVWIPGTLLHIPETRNLEPETVNPEPGTRNPEPETRDREPGTRNPEPGTRDLKPGTRNLKPESLFSLFVGAERKGLHLHKSINELLVAQRNLLHKCSTLTCISKACSNFRCQKAINSSLYGDESAGVVVSDGRLCEWWGAQRPASHRNSEPGTRKQRPDTLNPKP